MIIWNVSALKKANQWALVDPFGQSVLTSLPGQMRPHSMTYRGLFGTFWGSRYRSDKTRCAHSADPRPKNWRRGQRRLSEASFDQLRIRRRNEAVPSLTIRHHGRPPAITADNFLGKDRSAIEKVILKIRELRRNQRGDQGSTCNEERQHRKQLPPVYRSGKDNFLKKRQGHHIRLAPISASGLRSPFVREI